MGHFKATFLQSWSHSTRNSYELLLWITCLFYAYFHEYNQHSSWLQGMIHMIHMIRIPLDCFNGLQTEQYLSTKWCSSDIQCDMTTLPQLGTLAFTLCYWERTRKIEIEIYHFIWLKNYDTEFTSDITELMLDFQDLFLKYRQNFICSEPPYSSGCCPFLLLFLWTCWFRANM